MSIFPITPVTSVRSDETTQLRRGAVGHQGGGERPLPSDRSADTGHLLAAGLAPERSPVPVCRRCQVNPAAKAVCKLGHLPGDFIDNNAYRYENFLRDPRECSNA